MTAPEHVELQAGDRRLVYGLIAVDDSVGVPGAVRVVLGELTDETVERVGRTIEAAYDFIGGVKEAEDVAVAALSEAGLSPADQPETET